MKKILASIIPFVGIFLTSLLAFNTAFSQHANSISYYEPPTDKVIYMDVLRNDTVFELIFNKADSTIEVRDTNVNIGNGWWLMLSQSNGFIVVQRFRKIRPSLDFKKVNIKFAAQSEMQMTRCLAYKDFCKQEDLFSKNIGITLSPYMLGIVSFAFHFGQQI